jgi:primosomal protein N' (replication factor Y)
MSYRVPEALAGELGVGSAVVVPLSGYSRLGVVVEMGEADPDLALEDVKRPLNGLSLSSELVGLCRWISENATLPLPVVLRNALPPGLKIDVYRVVSPLPDWSWRRGTLVQRTGLRRELGKGGLREAEAGGNVALSPTLARRESVEWVLPCGGVGSGVTGAELSRAPRQRELFEKILYRGSCRVRPLLEEASARREVLKSLVDRGLVRLETRSGSSPVVAAKGSHEQPTLDAAAKAVQSWRANLWRVSSAEQTRAVAGICRAALDRWEQILVLAPEVRDVERMVEELSDLLPSGATLAPYHSGLGRERAAVYESARQGAVDVLVGTRAAALVPLNRPGAICVVDEPNGAHRAEPGFEGIPLHVREISQERARREGSAAIMLSPVPSLALYATARNGAVNELPAQETVAWPEAQVVDMRGSGAVLGRDLLRACREGMAEEDGVGVLVNRLGHSTAVSCAGCGTPVSCVSCGMPLALHGEATRNGLRGEMVCHHCARREPVPSNCASCGSERLIPTGLAVERARELLAEHLGERVGLVTADHASQKNARVVVGTAHEILAKNWNSVLVPDAASLLFGGGMFAAERGFRTLYSAAESSRRRILVQTRAPENAVLGYALRGDYQSFASYELPRRREAGYPPYRFLAALTLQGGESQVRRAVKSTLHDLESRVEAFEPVPLAKESGKNVWRVVLRAGDRRDIALAASAAAEIPASGNKRQTRTPSKRDVRRMKIELDPEEV